MSAIDKNLPSSFVRNYFQDVNPGYRQGTNEEVDALFNPSIQAKPLHVPLAGQIKKRLNSEMEFFWAFDRNGQNPHHERCERLRAVGFEYATTKDVDMAVADTVKGENEIRNGDLRLMRVSKQRWMEIRKDQQLRALMMIHPRSTADRSVMGTHGIIPGVKTNALEDAGEPGTIGAEVMRASAGMKGGVVEGNAGTELASGRVSSNASKVSLSKER